LNLLNVDYFYAEAFDDELARSGLDMMPRFAITFAILVVFSVLCTFIGVKDGSLAIDWVLSKPLLGIAGVITTFLSIISGVGLLLLFEVAFVDICRYVISTHPQYQLSIF
jgi:hypothetical protein